MLGGAIHFERVFDLFSIVKDAGGHTSRQEKMVDPGVDCEDEVGTRQQKEDGYLVEV